MSCATCFQSKPIPRCLGALIIGTLTASTDYIVRLKSFFNRVEEIEATSNGAGLLAVDLSSYELAEGVYHITVFDPPDMVTEKTITIGTETTTCIEVMVQKGTAASATIIEKV